MPIISRIKHTTIKAQKMHMFRVFYDHNKCPSLTQSRYLQIFAEALTKALVVQDNREYVGL